MRFRTEHGAWVAAAICAILLPIPVLAATTIYEGSLIPSNYDAPMPIVLQMDDDDGQLSGIGDARMPNSNPLRLSGSRFGSMCALTLIFVSQQKAHLEGQCSEGRFDGNFTLFNPKGDKRRGLFRMEKKKAQAGEKPDSEKSGASGDKAITSARTATACLKLKVACLSGCPRGDYNAEFICANTCRRKELACKGGKAHGKLQTPPPEPSFIPDGAAGE
ncbi:MAG: hypothetical protein PHU46_05700 [Rhodocyclaceae bacterium]|nr:hypothetical protein [Rhodocyclaceae bacterium]